MDTNKKTFLFEIDMDYLAGNGRAIAGLLISLGQSLEALYGQDLRGTDAKGDYFVAELRNDDGRIFGRALVSEADFVTESCISSDREKKAVVVDATVIVPVASEAGRHEQKMGRDNERTN